VGEGPELASTRGLGGARRRARPGEYGVGVLGDGAALAADVDMPEKTEDKVPDMAAAKASASVASPDSSSSAARWKRSRTHARSRSLACTNEVSMPRDQF